MRIIYEPRGRALEYAPLAVSLYRGCPHGCTYCFAPDFTRMKREDWHKYPRVRGTYHLMEKFEKDCAELAASKDQREILMSFTTDPYQPLDRDCQLTRAAIQIMIDYQRHFTILTKGGKRSTRDFDLLSSWPELCRYATTLTCSNLATEKKWEPNATPWQERIKALEEAHRLGIRTWVSIEPVIDPEQSLALISMTHALGCVDTYRIGMLNHEELPFPWVALYEFVKKVSAILADTDHVFKKDLQPYLQDGKT
jgi:DNA repair photolyase